MRRARIATVLGGIAVATLLTVSSASADAVFEIDEADTTSWDPSEPSTMKCVNNSVGQGCFRHSGDWFEVIDQKADGHSTLVVWRSIYPETQATVRQGTIWNTAGFNTYRYQNKNLTEDWILEFRVCAGEWGNTRVIDSTCSAWVTTKS